ncbi:hypothetical protein [Daejeonella sp. H1SJ63]|uniref:hypothetical protein n=1 Tax=Daejeonella sp. H1SJ63 TaxID=3034145 RepID=UPI0023ED322F|nr:hypothetical protein [Daejeonella sp. H1SJ63]
MKEINNEADSLEKDLDNLSVPDISKGYEVFLDKPLNLYPGFVNFLSSIKNCADDGQRLNKAEIFVNDFFNHMRKVRYIDDVEGFKQILNQKSLTIALAIVSKHKNIVAEKIDKDVFLGYEADSYDIFFRNSLQRLYEDLNNQKISKSKKDPGDEKPKALKKPIKSFQDLFNKPYSEHYKRFVDILREFDIDNLIAENSNEWIGTKYMSRIFFEKLKQNNVVKDVFDKDAAKQFVEYFPGLTEDSFVKKPTMVQGKYQYSSKYNSLDNKIQTTIEYIASKSN